MTTVILVAVKKYKTRNAVKEAYENSIQGLDHLVSLLTCDPQNKGPCRSVSRNHLDKDSSPGGPLRRRRILAGLNKIFEQV